MDFKWIVKVYEDGKKAVAGYDSHEPIVTIGFKMKGVENVRGTGQVGGYIPVPKSTIPDLITILRKLKK